MKLQDVATGRGRGRPLSTEAYDRVKRLIITCNLEPGERFTEGRLVRQLGIGKTPVREAISRLVQDGFVRNIPRLGYEVTPITIAGIDELFGLRLIVEPAAVQLAAGHINGEQLARLDKLCQAAYAGGDPDSAAEFLRANHEFHTTVAEASGNARLAAVVDRVLDQSERLFHVGLMLRNRSAELVHEHTELLDALQAGDGDLARRVATAQIVAARRMVLDAVLTSPSIVSTRVALRA